MSIEVSKNNPQYIYISLGTPRPYIATRGGTYLESTTRYDDMNTTRNILVPEEVGLQLPGVHVHVVLLQELPESLNLGPSYTHPVL